eukprot:UN31440
MTDTSYKVPRNFKLLEELENAEKGKYQKPEIFPNYKQDANWITLGLNDGNEDSKFTHWNASIIPHQGQQIGDRILLLKIVAGPGYPDIGPGIHFTNKVRLKYVNDKGEVNLNKIPNFKWKVTSSIFETLVFIRRSLAMQGVAKACSQVKGDY